MIETTWVGALAALYGKGADIVIALNPCYERAGKAIRKFSVAGHDVPVASVAEELNKLEPGWSGPSNNPTFLGSPWEEDSKLSLETVTDIVLSNL
ncbi:MAG: hypothetical protein ABH826_02935 [Patescibacteria group bacterium]